MGIIRAAWKLIKHGYRIIVELHEAHVLLGMAGFSITPTIVYGIWASMSGLPLPILVVTCIVVFSMLCLVGLGFFGYHRERASAASIPPFTPRPSLPPVVDLSNAPVINPEPVLSLHDVVLRITGAPALPPVGDYGRELESADCQKVVRACEELREKALNRLIDVFGGLDWRSTRPADYDNMVRGPISPEFWRSHRIDVAHFLRDADHRGLTVPLSGLNIGRGEEYLGIWFDKNQIETRWPSRHAAAQLIPLREAATELYTLARQRGTLLKSAAERLSGSGMKPGTPDEILDYVASYMCQTHKLRLYGKREPSTTVELIRVDDVKRAGFSEGATKLKERLSGPAIFSDLAVKRDEFDQLIRYESEQDRVD